jgi:competence protein ComEA
MGAQPPVYSSVSGPAKWAAVIALSFACGGGLVYSVMREPRGARERAPAVRVLPPRQVTAAPPSVAVPQPATLAPSTEPLPTATPQLADSSAPTTEPTREAEPAVVTPEVVAPTPEPEPEQASVARKININKATQSELELLPRVGPATAKAILAYRALHGPFRSVHELDKVKGIGPKTLEKLAPLVTVE